MSTSTPNARARRSPFGTATPSGDTTLTGVSAIYPITFWEDGKPLTVLPLYSSNALLAIHATLLHQVDLLPQPPRAPNGPPLDTHHALEVWVRQQHHTDFVPCNNERQTPLVGIADEAAEKPEPIEEPVDEFERLDNEPEIERPRLSLPIQESEEEGEEASPEMRPPRMSLAFAEEDMDITYQSVEYPRDTSIRDRDRLSMMSRATGRISGDFDETRLESDGGDGTGIVGEDDEAEDTMMSGGDFDRGGETEDLGRFHFDLNFPSPAAPPLEDPTGGDMNDMEDFELSTAQLPQAPSDDDDNDVGGDFGLGLEFPPAASPSESPGIVGGGLRDEAIPAQGKQKKMSRHGIPVPNLPAGVVKKLATRFARSGAGSKAKINKATLAAIEQASSWYFEQASQDLAAYSKHAGRKTIDESDVITLLKRQRHINNSTTVFSLAQKHLPKELQQDMRLAMPP
ncbi:hypothetical protein N7489_002785 [Penicillium chrysogenum]|uniref:uncharacterized protein n=1 Tax=Penicillium chrysogenum TaxID=5076 RepID=UPI0024DF2613|nr:uncharacterized protein N7489_002785 [Penicillium chrysogenum]KAJ5252375.1 hypothetical protein N7489_002785 [Penicillium chrysogenum]KAJ6145960.1 hypothetical protein N7497_007942 [Penicillium chrysogenum]